MSDMSMHISSHEPLVADVPAEAAGFMEMFQTPAQLDQSVRQAVQLCWTIIPKERRTTEELERQFRRVAERALKDFAEDKAEFGPSASDVK
jgi:uncharacterized protein Yka (UPF0111/DUF47 family)